MNILLQGRIAVDGKDRLQACAEPHWQIDVWDPDTKSHEDFIDLASRCVVMVGGNIPLASWPAVPQLKLFQIPWAGFNHTGPDKIPAGVPVCNCFEHESSIAEYVMLGMLEWEIRLSRMDQSMRSHGWNGKIVGLTGGFHGELSGKTVGFVGYGHIAQAVAARAASFGMELKAVRRSKKETPTELSWLGSQDDLPELLATSDYVVIACDLNPATRNLFDAKAFELMKPEAVLINVSRGGIVEEEAFYNALLGKQIAGAVNDVWYNYNEAGKAEVSPFNFPFDQLDNIIMSAHESGWTDEQVNRRWKFIANNIRRVEAGESANNIVFTGEAATAT